ncbi:MAG: signal recognition particle-docking protein FtsY [Deltaproteobacteria bacterium]|nr:signal recognition particle-docking protein FtsY [Deltaproteobacteria bacterium]
MVVEPVAKPRGPEPKLAREDERVRLTKGLSKTRKGFVARLGRLFRGKKELDPNLLEEIEEVLLTADIGVKTSQKLFEELKDALDRKSLQDQESIWRFLKTRASQILMVDASALDLDAARPFVILTIGVNGVGKTTTIGKLAAKFHQQGKSVLLAAGDTFRAAAVEQLQVWGQRVGVEVVQGKAKTDPSAVIFDAIKKARDENIDVVIADTAGRLHTKVGLMDELKKVHRVMGKAQEGAPHETLLVLDATTGQNAIQQALLFKEAVSFSGIVLTKLDGTAKGGVILGVCDELNVPVRFIGIGERTEDLRDFSADAFVDALFSEAE